MLSSCSSLPAAVDSSMLHARGTICGKAFYDCVKRILEGWSGIDKKGKPSYCHWRPPGLASQYSLILSSPYHPTPLPASCFCSCSRFACSETANSTPPPPPSSSSPLQRWRHLDLGTEWGSPSYLPGSVWKWGGEAVKKPLMEV